MTPPARILAHGARHTRRPRSLVAVLCSVHYTRQMITVKELLEGKLIQGARLLAGREGLRKSAAWAVTAHARTPALGPLQGGEIVLLPPPALRHLGGPAVLASLVSGLADQGAAGACIWTEPDAEALDTADRVGLPLIQIGDTVAPDVERQLLDHIASRLRTGLRQQEDRQANLLDALAASEGMQGIVNVLAETLELPVAYFPSQGPVIRSAGASDTPIGAALRQLPRGQNITMVDPGDRRGAIWVASVVRAGSRLGVLVVEGVHSEPSAAEALFIRQTSSAILAETRRLDAAHETEKRLRDNLYRDLLEGRVGDLDVIYMRARSLGLRIPVEARVTVVAATDPSRPLSEVLKERLLTYHASYPIVDQGREIVLISPLILRGAPLEAFLRKLIGPMGASVSAGVSDVINELRQIPNALKEARLALLVGRRKRGGGVLTWTDTGVDGLLAPLRDTPEARRSVERLLNPLLSYDERHDASLTQTLETYVECNGNASVAAHRLSLHRNSLAYRLRRIEELTAVSLADSESRLLLTLALRLRRLL